jgi:ubiquinol oxidase
LTVHRLFAARISGVAGFRTLTWPVNAGGKSRQTMLNVNKTDLLRHHVPAGLADRFAQGTASLLSSIATAVFSRRYGDRVVVLETVAAVPAIVSATLLHLRCLRRMTDDRGWIRTFMVEAENQRAHLMSFVAIAKPNGWERLLIVLAQGVFYNSYFLLHLVSSRTAHRLAGYMSEQAVQGYSRYIERLKSGAETDIGAPEFAIDYWHLSPTARISEMLAAMREDEAIHRDIQHAFADAIASGNVLPDLPVTQV